MLDAPLRKVTCLATRRARRQFYFASENFFRLHWTLPLIVMLWMTLCTSSCIEGSMELTSMLVAGKVDFVEFSLLFIFPLFSSAVEDFHGIPPFCKTFILCFKGFKLNSSSWPLYLQREQPCDLFPEVSPLNKI